MDMGKYCKRKRYIFNTADARFCYDPDLNIKGYDGFYLGDNFIELQIYNKDLVDNINFYTHEFSEMAILGAIRKCTRKWRGTVKFKHFAPTDISHLLSPYAYPNKRCLYPDMVSFRKVYLKLINNLTKEELNKRKDMGFDW
jgi:hypothetical protein